MATTLLPPRVQESASSSTSSLATPAATGQQHEQQQQSSFLLPRWTPSLPTNMLSMINPFGPSESTKATTPEGSQDATETATKTTTAPATATPTPAPTTTTTSTLAAISAPFWKRPTFTAILSRATPPPAAPPIRSQPSVMFAEPEVADSDGASRDGSLDDGEKRRRRKAQNSNRPKTLFSICHPPPASLTRQKLHRRPRSLLQLHRLSENDRPVPAFEVVPSANFSVRLTRSITKIYKTKHGLCPSDLVVLKAENYYTEEREEEQGAQDILALICRGRKDDTAIAGKAKICMSNGRMWEASSHVSGGYEFFTTDDHGLGITVRWVPKRCKEGKQPNSSGTKRFNFSTISPNTRRHPVIASLSSTGLDVNDTYRVPDPAAFTPMSTPKQTDTFLGDAMEEEGIDTDECVTDDKLRDIIVVTAVWVACKEGWSPSLKVEDKESASPRKESATPLSTPPASPILEKRNSVRSVGSSMFRRSSVLSRAARNSTTSIDSITSSETAAVAPQKTGRARSDSNSTVLVHRAASNRRRQNKQATWRPDLLDKRNAVTEASQENLPRTPKPKSKRLSTIESPSSPTPRFSTSKRASQARPIIPPVASDSESETAESPRQEETAEKRGSSTTDNTESSEAPRTTGISSKSSKKSRRWRKMLCIS